MEKNTALESIIGKTVQLMKVGMHMTRRKATGSLSQKMEKDLKGSGRMEEEKGGEC